jgi:DNA-directed RNA polymerase sigma subunit (sigma70/sigma32)
MNLRAYKGRVPIPTGDEDTPIRLVDFPTRTEFDALWGKLVKDENKERYWHMLSARAKGSTFAEVARAYAISRERMRQIEAKFLRLMRRKTLLSSTTT